MMRRSTRSATRWRRLSRASGLSFGLIETAADIARSCAKRAGRGASGRGVHDDKGAVPTAARGCPLADTLANSAGAATPVNVLRQVLAALLDHGAERVDTGWANVQHPRALTTPLRQEPTS